MYLSFHRDAFQNHQQKWDPIINPLKASLTLKPRALSMCIDSEELSCVWCINTGMEVHVKPIYSDTLYWPVDKRIIGLSSHCSETSQYMVSRTHRSVISYTWRQCAAVSAASLWPLLLFKVVERDLFVSNTSKKLQWINPFPCFGLNLTCM